MVLDKRASVLALEDSVLRGIGEREGRRYWWNPEKDIWTHMEYQNKTNLFSKVGIGVKTVVFTLRKASGITLHKALSYKGRHFLITDSNTDDPLLMVVTAADIQPVQCTVTRREEREGPNKSSILVPCMQFLFPACVTEKYMGFQQEDPMARTEATLVLVTPKPVRLEVHDIVKLGAPGPEGAEDTRPAFAIKVCHLLDEYKNEYEMTRKEDV